jgi:peptidoglycan/LPS O-acetylase OafA/YrhL
MSGRMLGRTRGLLRRRRRRAAILCAVVLLGLSVAAAHTSVADDHVGQAATMCLAVMAAGGAAVAALPPLGRVVPRPHTLVGAPGLACPTSPLRQASVALAATPPSFRSSDVDRPGATPDPASRKTERME